MTWPGIADDVVWRIVEERVQASFSNEGIKIEKADFSGEASKHEVERIATQAKDVGVKIRHGCRRWKTLDTAKAVSDELHLPVVIVPTIASTDAPTSALSVIYSYEGGFESYRFSTRKSGSCPGRY